MTANFSGGGSGGLDYVQPDEPADPDVGEQWFDTDADPDGDGNAEGEVFVYGADGTWTSTGYIDHRNLSNTTEDNHHTYPIPTAGLAVDAVTAAKIAAGAVGPDAASLGNALGDDGVGNIAVQEGGISLSNLSGYPVGTGDLGFNSTQQSSDTTTQERYKMGDANGETTRVGEWTTEVEVVSSNLGDVSGTVYFEDGTTRSYNLSASESSVVYSGSPKVLKSIVEDDGNYSATLKASRVLNGSHVHNV